MAVVSPSVVILVLALAWFVVFWIVGGVVFSIISLTRFLHIHKARFSCLFTLSSVGAAYAAGWLGTRTLFQFPCVGRMKGILDIFPTVGVCATRQIFSAGVLVFLLLMAIGILLMFLFRRSDS